MISISDTRQLKEKTQENYIAIQEQDEKAYDKLNFLAYTYCPLKLTFKESFEETLKKYMTDTADNDFTYYVPSGCSSDDPYEDIWKVENIEKFPEIVASVGFGDFFHYEFVERYVSKGYFKAISLPEINKAFIDSGLVDMNDWYTVYSVLPLVMLIDRKKLGQLPVPKQWQDLLDPVYSNNIIIGASHGDIHEDLLLYIHKEFGDYGIIKLAGNVKEGWHASQMAKTAGTNSSDGAAIYVMPWMFAKACPRTETTEVIWPLDGAVTTPIYMLTRENLSNKYKPFIDFILGADYGQKSANNFFPVMNSTVDNKLPEGAKFKWLGWNYIRAHSMNELKEHVVKVFLMHWKKGNEKKEEIV